MVPSGAYGGGAGNSSFGSRPRGFSGGASAGMPVFDPRTNTSYYNGQSDSYKPGSPTSGGRPSGAPVVTQHSLGGQQANRTASDYGGKQSGGDYGAYAPKQGAYQAYRPNRAQPIQPQSQGTPYGLYAVAPGQPIPSQIPSDIAPPPVAKQTMGGSYSDPRWARNGGSWGDNRQDPQSSQQGVSNLAFRPDRPVASPARPSIRTTDWRDHNGNGVDDRDEPGGANAPFMPPNSQRYQNPPGLDYPYDTFRFKGMRPPAQSVTGDQQGGYASTPPQLRPPPFQVNPSQTPWGPSADPFSERQAVIEQLNQQRMQRQMGFNRTAQQPGMPSWWGSAPQPLDYGGAVNGAGLGQGSPSLGQSGTWMDSMNQQFRPAQVGGLRAWGDPGDPTGPNYDPNYLPPPPRPGMAY